MATRSAIGYATPAGRIRAAYCHWDGYPEHQMPILTSYFIKPSIIRRLVKLGSMSSLWTSMTWEPGQVRDPQPLHHCERGDATPPHLCQSLMAAQLYWATNWSCEHLYVFWPDQGWKHYALDLQ